MLVIASCSKPTHHTPHMTTNRTAAGTPDATGWYPAHSDGGKFGVLLPGPYNDLTATEPNDRTGAPLTVQIVGTQFVTGVKYMAACAWGGTDSGELLDTYGENMPVTSRRELTVDGHRAVELKLGTVGLKRAIGYDDHVCTLTVESQGNKVPISEPDALKMFDSFKPDK